MARDKNLAYSCLSNTALRCSGVIFSRNGVRSEHIHGQKVSFPGTWGIQLNSPNLGPSHCCSQSVERAHKAHCRYPCSPQLPAPHLSWLNVLQGSDMQEEVVFREGGLCIGDTAVVAWVMRGRSLGLLTNKHNSLNSGEY